MWIWRRVKKTNWIERKSNLRVLHVISESSNFTKDLVTFTGHLPKPKELVTDIIEGEVLNKSLREAISSGYPAQ